MKVRTGLAALLLSIASGIALAGQPRIIIDISDRQMTVYDKKTIIATYPVGVGSEEFPTPRGEFEIQNIVKNPVWYPNPEYTWLSQTARNYIKENGCISYGHELNPLRGYWIGLTGGTGIHGTNQPWTIGYADSHSCIRMLEQDINDLARLVCTETKVTIKD
ncbi:L,D-transpeptidase [Candidatus Woesearchaeota archaeon]|nr:L,D-transpeptidase [Candidatus Woesearchaeota archaeon]